MNKQMRRIIFFTGLSFISFLATGQDYIGQDLKKLAKLKLWNELYDIPPLQKENDLEGKNSIKDSIYREYVSLINKVKTSPKTYLSYINRELKRNPDSLRKQSILYRNPTPTVLYGYDPYSIKIIDLYRVIKYSLLENNDSYLPIDFRTIGIVDPKNYYGYYEPEPKRKEAIKYIIKNFTLEANEKKFLKNKLNVGYVMDIKKFLDTCEETNENRRFIRESIATFVKSKEIPLAGLYFYFQLSKDTKKYIPKDKELDQ